MTKKQRVIDEFFIDVNATKASNRARYRSESADAIGHENLIKARVSAAVSTRMKAHELRLRVVQCKSFEDIARIAFFDPRQLSHADGRIKMPQELDEDTAAAIESFEMSADGSLKYKFRDKLSALDEMFKLLGLYEKHAQ